MHKDCPFCTRANIENRILKEGKYTFVILSNPRLIPGHTLIVPKRHLEGKLKDLTADERNEIFDFLAEFQNKIIKKITAGCDIRQNYKPYVENSKTHVNHMHFHLYPRDYKDEIHEQVDVYRKPIYRELSGEEKNRLVALFSE